MTTSVAIAIAIGWMMALAVAGTAIGQSIATAHAMDAIARQPESAGDIRSSLLLALGLMEALTIYALLIAFMLIGKI